MAYIISSGESSSGITLNTFTSMCVSSGGTADSTTVNGFGSMFVSSGGTANSTTVNSGWLIFSCGGVANNTAVDACGYHYVSSGGTANSTTVNFRGIFIVSSGGTANSTTVNSRGSMYVCSDARLTGQTMIENGACVSVSSGAVLDFDISDLAPGAAARINDLSLISGWTDALYTLTVTDTQALGTYSLAGGAKGFNKTISVVNSSGTGLGTLTVGKTVDVGGSGYTLGISGSDLLLTIGAASEPEPPGPEPSPGDKVFFTGDFNGDLSDTLAVENDGVVTVYMNGERWGLGVTLDPGWEIAGVGDFNGDGLDDFLRVHASGLVIGEMSDGNGTFAPQVLNFKGEGWDILGTGDFNGNGTDDVLVANPTGASETVGLLGYWESGATWTLINGYSPEWECVSTGDFNGDGKCDMLWRNSFEGDGGLTYNAYCTWIVEPSDGLTDWRMVSVANPDEWDFLCSGDFDGDGMNDIAMVNDVGVVGIWGVNDGYLNSWSILSAVTSEWQLAGVGDFNGDGTDDIAWCNMTTGLAGYWQINDKQLTTWSNIATLS